MNHKWVKKDKNTMRCANGCGFEKDITSSKTFYLNSKGSTFWGRPNCVNGLAKKDAIKDALKDVDENITAFEKEKLNEPISLLERAVIYNYLAFVAEKSLKET